MQELIRNAYYDPSTGLQSAVKLYDKLKDKGITLKQIKDFINSQEVYQLHKTSQKIKKYFPISAGHENEIMQIDLADFSDIYTTNSNYKFLFCAIDVFTRKSYVVPMKNKTTSNIIDAMKIIFSKATPEIINCDLGSEFISNEFKKLMKDHNINIRYVQVNDHKKLGVIDRFIRTLRGLINKYQSAYKTTRYIDVLDKLVENYNNTFNSGIKGIPNKPDELKLKTLNYKKYMDAKNQEVIFNINDNVRYLKNKIMFSKGSLPSWSSSIHKIINNNKHSYVLDNGKSYKYYELQKVDNSQSYEKELEITRENIRKDNRVKRTLKRENLDTSKILTNERIRKIRPELQKLLSRKS